jgi:hypothetical protein
MSQTIQISDDAYRILETLAQRDGQTPAQLVESWATDRAPHDPNQEPHYYTTEDWFRHLGVSEERIQKALKEAHEEVGEYDADPQ